MNERQRQQRQHEEYWGRCWTAPLGRYFCADVQSRRAENDAHDIEFRIQRSDGTVTASWGEVTGAYYDNKEAEWLWGAERPRAARDYIEPDARTGMEARDLAARKLGKYRNVADVRGRGHLLILLHCPLTTRSTRVDAERRIRELLDTETGIAFNPFETVWLGYRLPLTVLEEREDPEHVFHDGEERDRFNFLKRIWSGRSP